MLLVKAKAAPSSIAGVGLFAEEFIPKGTLMWELGPCDKVLTREEVEKLDEPLRSEILSLHHSYISKQTGRYIMPGDISIYVNHSKNPNMLSVWVSVEREDEGVAGRDIHPGEEITADYDSFAAEGVDFN
jgi:SET domain-containing protein